MAIDVKVEADELDNFLKSFEEKLEKACENIIDELAERSLDEMRKNYASAEYQAGEEMDFAKVGTKKEKYSTMVGPQAWYSEFGTGTRGELQPHPLKGRYGLNDYNTGETIRTASAKVAQKEGAIRAGIKEGDLYWTYQANDGQIYYTQGIPAQKEVYNAGQTIQKEIPMIVENYMKGLFT